MSADYRSLFVVSELDSRTRTAVQLIQSHMTLKPMLRVEVGAESVSCVLILEAQQLEGNTSAQLVDTFAQCGGGGAPLLWLFSLLVGPQVRIAAPLS